jgi:GT2 family glycosyltransferase
MLKTAVRPRGKAPVPTPAKTVTAIIATRHRPDPLRRCLASLTQQSRTPDSVIIVDASDDSRTKAVIEECTNQIRGLRWVKSPYASAARQRNLGADTAETDVVLFLDDDVVLDPHFVAEIMTVFESELQPPPAGVSGTITNQVYSDPKGLNRLLLGLCTGRFRGSYAGRVVGPAVNFLPQDCPDMLQEVEWLPSTCTAYERQVFLNERFGEFEGYSFAEDVHLSLRVAQNYRLVNTSKARVFHEDLGQHTHKDWFAIGRSQVLNRHLILASVLERRSLPDALQLFAYEMIYCPVAYLAAGVSARRLRILTRLVAGKVNGFSTLLRAVR